MKDYFNLGDEEKGYTTKIIDSEKLIAVHSLRHKVFAEELSWIESTENKLDTDRYDQDSITLGVFNSKNKLSGCLRIIPHDKPFMLENDFNFLIDKNHILRKKSDTVEISRFCIDFDSRFDNSLSSLATSIAAFLLYRKLYQWCRLKKVRFLYAVVNSKFLRRLKLSGLPFKSIGPSTIMPGCTEAVAVLLDWREFEHYNFKYNIGRLKWFNKLEN